jgi:FXSXX-COOH protein
MEPDSGEVVTVMVDLSGVSLVDVPVLAGVVERLVRGGEQVSAFQSSI